MKIKNLFYVSLAALSLAACSKDEVTAPQSASVVVKLESITPSTKADLTDAQLQSLNAEKAISTGTLYVFENNTIITSVQITGASVTIPNLVVGSTYNFAAVVNPGTNQITATTKAGLKETVIALSSKESGHFVMYGESMDNNSGQQTVTVSNDEGANNSLTVNVKRVLSGVQLVSIKTNFDSNVPEFARLGSGVIKSLKLLNTNPTSALNGAVIDGTKIEGVSASFADVRFGSTLTEISVSAESNANRAYCCPGSIGYVVLEVVYTYKDQSYNRFYNIPALSNMQNGLVANTLYGLNVTLTGAGSGEGGNPDDFESAGATLTVADWSNGTIIDVDQEN